MERAAKTWTGEWWKYGGGGTPWDGIAYDPEADLVYVGTGNGSPWSQNHRSPGGGDNLYLSSIVALKADTGEYVWHYQTTPGDNWDYNAAQPMILADLTIGGQPRKVIMQAPKNGFFYVLDRLTGEFISAEPYRHRHVGDGRRSEDRPPDGDRAGALPLHAGPAVAVAGRRAPLAADGVESRHAAWSTSRARKPARSSAWKRSSSSKKASGTSASRAAAAARRRRRPNEPPPPRGGFIVAWDPVAQKARWRIPVTPSGGMLSTAGTGLRQRATDASRAARRDRRDSCGSTRCCRAWRHRSPTSSTASSTSP